MQGEQVGISDVTKAVASGIPHLYEWGGLVTLLTIIMFILIAALCVLGVVIWKMYNQNQLMFKESLTSSAAGTDAIERLTEYIKGLTAKV